MWGGRRTLWLPVHNWWKEESKQSNVLFFFLCVCVVARTRSFKTKASDVFYCLSPTQFVFLFLLFPFLSSEWKVMSINLNNEGDTPLYFPTFSRFYLFCAVRFFVFFPVRTLCFSLSLLCVIGIHYPLFMAIASLRLVESGLVSSPQRQIFCVRPRRRTLSLALFFFFCLFVCLF